MRGLFVAAMTCSNPLLGDASAMTLGDAFATGAACKIACASLAAIAVLNAKCCANVSRPWATSLFKIAANRSRSCC